jgi:hypothetical protein
MAGKMIVEDSRIVVDLVEGVVEAVFGKGENEGGEKAIALQKSLEAMDIQYELERENGEVRIRALDVHNEECIRTVRYATGNEEAKEAARNGKIKQCVATAEAMKGRVLVVKSDMEIIEMLLRMVRKEFGGKYKRQMCVEFSLMLSECFKMFGIRHEIEQGYIGRRGRCARHVWISIMDKAVDYEGHQEKNKGREGCEYMRNKPEGWREIRYEGAGKVKRKMESIGRAGANQANVDAEEEVKGIVGRCVNKARSMREKITPNEATRKAEEFIRRRFRAQFGWGMAGDMDYRARADSTVYELSDTMDFYTEVPEEARRSLDGATAFEVKTIAARKVEQIRMQLSQMGVRVFEAVSYKSEAEWVKDALEYRG